MAQIGCEKIGSRAGFCVYTCATNSDLCQMWARDRIFCASVNAACDAKHFFTSEACLSFSLWVACKAVRVNVMSVRVNAAEANYCRFRSSASQTTLSSQTCRQRQHGIKHTRSSLPVKAKLQIRPRTCSWTTHIHSHTTHLQWSPWALLGNLVLYSWT